MKLLIGNKNYSSWSFRVWLAMKVKDIPFEEDLRPFDVENNYKDYFEFSPSGKVPVLQNGDETIWESLAILEYLAEQYPQKNLWPENKVDRAQARCVSNEMLAGFMTLRAACPMNMRRVPTRLSVSETVSKEVNRIETIWDQCLQKSGGPFLFGEFCSADSMYAPVVNRFHIYQLSKSDVVNDYTDTITSLTAWQEWEKAARSELWTVEVDEV